MIRKATPDDFAEMAIYMQYVQLHALEGLLPARTTPEEHMLSLSRSADCAFAFEHDGVLVAIAGFQTVHPGVASTFYYSTEHAPHCFKDIHRFFLGMLGRLKMHGYHRVHALGLASDRIGRKWKEKYLGAEIEAILAKYGSNGEDYILHRLILDAPESIL